MSSGGPRVRSGRLFEEGPALVRRTAWALRDQPGLYADIPVDPDKLDRQQDRAAAWLKLHRLFTMLARRAADCFLQDQSEAITTCMGVVNHVRADRARTYPHPRQRERALGMALPEQVLADRHQRKGRAIRNAEKARARAEKKAARAEARIAPVLKKRVSNPTPEKKTTH